MNNKFRLIVVVLVISSAMGIAFAFGPDEQITISHAFENIYRFEGRPLEDVTYTVVEDHLVKFEPQVEVTSGSAIYRVNLKSGLVESAKYGDASEVEGPSLTIEEAWGIAWDFAVLRYPAFGDLSLVTEFHNTEEGNYHFVWAQLLDGIRTPHSVSITISADNSAVMEYSVRPVNLKGVKTVQEVGAEEARSVAEEVLGELPVSGTVQLSDAAPELRIVWAIPMDKYVKVLQEWNELKSPGKLRSEMKLILAWLMPLEWDSEDDGDEWPGPFPVNAVNGEPYVLAHL